MTERARTENGREGKVVQQDRIGVERGLQYEGEILPR
jgi:hypothetical protein